MSDEDDTTLSQEGKAAGMRLYHFTSSHHLAKILADGYLKTTESNLSRTRAHAGPDVVWLTSNPNPASHKWWHVSGMRSVDKSEIRFTVDVPDQDVTKWKRWASRRGIDPRWAHDLMSAGGGNTWYVSEKVVPSSQWVELLNTRTGEPIELPERELVAA